jgi:CRISPR-associated endonuclease/helicase Cas3
MLQVKKRKEIFQRLSQCSISVPTKYLNEWYEHCGALIWDDEEKMIEQVGKDMWLVSQQGIGTIYRLDIGFVPLEIADLLLEIVTDT